MTIAPGDKQRLLERLTKARIRGLNIPVLRAICWYIHPKEGVAFARYHHYEEKSGRSGRTVQRTIQVARKHLILSLAYREGPPAIWCPGLMDMTPEEAVRRADVLADNFRRGNVATPTSLITPAPPPVDHPAPSVATTTEPAPAATTAVPTHQFLASELAPKSAPDLASELAPDLAPLKPQEENSRQKQSGRLSSPPPPPRGGGGGGDDAAWRSPTKLPPASSAAHDLAVKIGELCGLGSPTWKWPEHWRRNAPIIVQSWLSDQGWEENLIICVVKDEMKKKTDGPPDSIRYFQKPIGRLYARLAQQHAELVELQARLGRR